jgi:phosphate-selective porin OprO and OprP
MAETDRPSIDFGNILHVEIQAKIQAGFRHFTPALPSIDTTQLEKARIGLRGRILDHFFYEIEREFRQTLGADPPTFPWTDVYVESRGYPPFDIRVGKFKLPLGMEENTSTAKLDFVNRALISELLAPGRDKGAVVTGRLFEGLGLKYEAGVFLNDGENSHATRSNRKSGGPAFSGRVEGQPAHGLKFPLRKLQLGVSIVSSNVPAGSPVETNSMRGETVSGMTFFHRVFVQGRRLRMGTQMNWREGPFSAQAEYIRVSEQRRHVGIQLQSLPDLISHGWYGAGTWLITGEKKSDVIKPKTRFGNKGIGALEVAVRYDTIQFNSGSQIGVPSRSPRAPNILENGDRVLTVGLNWYLNEFSKIQVNRVRETLQDPASTPIANYVRYWATVVRVQFHM